jgi:hypothetical protein
MTVIDFPATPTLGDTYIANGKTWIYQNNRWEITKFGDANNGYLDGGTPATSTFIATAGTPNVKTTWSATTTLNGGTP